MSGSKGETGQIFSKDAYMLVYTRREPEHQKAEGTSPKPLTVPNAAAQLVEKHNAQFTEECQVYSSSVEQKRGRFRQYQEDIKAVYHSWDASSPLDADVVSKDGLESWLAEDAITAFFNSEKAKGSEVEVEEQCRISNEDITCIHSALDPQARERIKLVKSSALVAIQEKTGCSFSPRLVPGDACRPCTESVFLEKLYLQQHPVFVERWDCLSDRDVSSWISKRWLRDWKSPMPKMHFFGELDPSPGAPQFDLHVRCEHGGLTLNKTLRQAISASAVALLQEIYPEWKPLPANSENCVVCQASVERSKDDTVKLRKQAEEEKTLLSQLLANIMDDNAFFTENCIFVALPRSFTDAWRKWITRPSDKPRPVHIETENLLCEHGNLNFDPNQAIDLTNSVFIAKESDWEALRRYYTTGPMIQLTAVSGPDSAYTFVHEQSSCTSCRMRLKTDFEETSLFVLLHGVLPRDTSLLATPARPHHSMTSSTTATRRSKRLRDTNNSIVRKAIKVKKASSVKDMKLSIQQAFKIPMLYQALYYSCRELANEETVASLTILADDILDLYHLPEHVDSTDDEKDTTEGPGFGGTLLQGCRTGTLEPQGKQCSQCTYLNLVAARACEICEAPL